MSKVKFFLGKFVARVSLRVYIEKRRLKVRDWKTEDGMGKADSRREMGSYAMEHVSG
jgi:hypothetical protein